MKLNYLNTKTFETYSISFSPEDDLPEIDENMCYIISILNKKGYKTQFCCEGHYEKNENNQSFSIVLPYISFFENEHYFTPDIIPDLWYIEIDDKIYSDEVDNLIDGYRETLYLNCPLEVDDEYTFQRIKLKGLLTLLDWVQALPHVMDL